MNRTLNIYKTSEAKTELLRTITVCYLNVEDKEKFINIIDNVNNSGKFIITAYGFNNVLNVYEFENVCKDLSAL